MSIRSTCSCETSPCGLVPFLKVKSSKFIPYFSETKYVMISAFSFILITIVWIVIGTTKLKLHPFLVLITGCLFCAFSLQLPFKIIPQVFAEGFGKTIKSSIFAPRFVRNYYWSCFRKNKSNSQHRKCTIKITVQIALPFAVSCIGYVVSIPVFCDSAFVILSSLNKSLAEKQIHQR